MRENRKKIESRYIYKIKENEISALKEIIERFQEPGIREIISNRRRELSHVNIAFQWYQNSFINIESLESQVSYAISCLEALYTRDG